MGAISSYKNIRRVIVLLSVGRSLRSMNDFQRVKETSLWQDRSLTKFSWRYDQELSSGAWQRSALYTGVQKCNGDFIGP